MKRLPIRPVLLALAVLLAVALAAGALRAPAVETVQPEVRDVTEVVVASGRVRAVRESSVGADVAGVVAELYVREGDAVRRGQPLGRLNAPEVQALLVQVRQAVITAEATLRAEEAALAQAGQDLERIAELAERRQVAQADLDRARTTLAARTAAAAAARSRLREANAEVERAGPELAKRELRAPFDGLVLRREVEPGVAVGAGQAWFRVAEMADTELFVETDENNLGRLRRGQSGIAVAPAFPDRPFAVRLEQIGPNVDPDRGVVGLRLRAERLPDFALPNMTVDVSVEVERVADALALPRTAVLGDRRAAAVLVVERGRVRRQAVRLLGANPEWAAVTGLEADSAVVRRAAGVKPGTRARAVPDAP